MSNFASDPEGPFLQQHLKKIDGKNGVVLYEVSQEPLRQEVISYDFLRHIDAARITMPAALPDRSNQEYRMKLAIGDDSRYVLLSFPAGQVEYSLTVPERAALRFAIGRQFPPCDSPGTFAVEIRTPDGATHLLYQRELWAGNTQDAAGWNEEEISLEPYANQPVRLTFRNSYGGGEVCNRFLWADPVIVVRP